MRDVRAILRGMKFATYGFLGLLACVLIYNAMTLEPAAQRPSVNPDLENTGPQQTAVDVPPPPPLPGRSKGPVAVQARAKPKKPGIGSGEVPQIHEVEVHVAEIPAAVAAPSSGLEVQPATPAAVVPKANAPKDDQQRAGIVIVVPPEAPARENRGLHWIRAVGRKVRDLDKD